MFFYIFLSVAATAAAAAAIFYGILEFQGILKKSWLKWCIQFSFMPVCKYLNQRVKEKRLRMENIFSIFFFSKGFSKNAHTQEEFEFHYSIQDWVFTTIYIGTLPWVEIFIVVIILTSMLATKQNLARVISGKILYKFSCKRLYFLNVSVAFVPSCN